MRISYPPFLSSFYLQKQRLKSYEAEVEDLARQNASLAANVSSLRNKLSQSEQALRTSDIMSPGSVKNSRRSLDEMVDADDLDYDTPWSFKYQQLEVAFQTQHQELAR